MVKRALIILAVILGAGWALWFAFSTVSKSKRTEIPEIKNIPDQIQTLDQESQNEDFPRLSVVAKNLEIPWSLVFLPSGEILVTERPGRVRIIDKEGNLSQSPVITISEVKHIGEGGLLGIAISPDFESDKYVYVYYTYSEDRGNTKNRVARYSYVGGILTNPQTIIENIPGASNHDGGRIKFGSDGFLYITTGDAQDPSQSQSTSSTAGKILKITPDGKPAPGNPFNNPVFSYGHRNPQGIAWDSQGRLWSTEHGRSGAQSGLDELNLIESGKNYGWDIIEGDETRSGMVTPVIHSGASTTWAPSGLAFLNGSLYFGGLRGTSLFEYKIETKQLERHLNGELGRIRDVVVGTDNMLYITTSNRDGRGTPTSDDDRIVRVNPTRL